MSPAAILSTLLITATIIGAKLYTSHELKSKSSPPTSTVEDRNYITALETQLEQLEKENQSLRQLATSEANTTLPAPLIEFVEEDLGLKFITPPVARTTIPDIIAEAAGQRYLAAFSETGMQMRAYTLEKLGIIPPNQNFIGQLITAETNGSRGYYDLTSSEILLASDFDPENIHHLASAARLLVIALLDQHSPLPKSVTDDAFHARAAAHRGRAAMTQTRFYTINARKIGFIAEKPNPEAIETFQALAPYVKALTTFPNTEGKTYIENLHRKDNALTLAALQTPPETTSDILAGTLPQNYTTPSQLPVSPDTQLTTRLGTITIRSYLAQILSPEEAAQLTAQHLSDNLTLVTTGQKNVTATTSWNINWKNKRAASTFANAASELLEAHPTSATITTSGTTTTITHTETNIPTDQ